MFEEDNLSVEEDILAADDDILAVKEDILGVEEDILDVGEDILTVFDVSVDNLAVSGVVADNPAGMGGNILIVKVEEENCLLFDMGILAMAGMVEYFAGRVEDLLAVVAA